MLSITMFLCIRFSLEHVANGTIIGLGAGLGIGLGFETVLCLGLLLLSHYKLHHRNEKQPCLRHRNNENVPLLTQYDGIDGGSGHFKEPILANHEHQ